MPIDFSKFEAPEGVTPEVLANPQLIKYINDSIDKEKTAAVSLIDAKRNEAVTAKAISDQKIEDLQKKLEDASANPASDNDEVQKLRTQLKNAKEEATVEANAKLDALTKQLEDQKGATTQLEQKLDDEQLTSYLRDGIARYNAKFKGLAVEDGAEPHVISAAKQFYKKTDDGSFRAFEGEQAMTGSEGFISRVELMSKLRDEPQNAFFFKRPTGGGATGANGGGASQQKLAGNQKERTQALKNKFPELASG